MVNSIPCLAVRSGTASGLQNPRPGLPDGRCIRPQLDRTRSPPHQRGEPFPRCRCYLHGRMGDSPELFGHSGLVRSGAVGLLCSERYRFGLVVPDPLEDIVVIVIATTASARRNWNRNHTRLSIVRGSYPFSRSNWHQRYDLSDSQSIMERNTITNTR